MHIEGTLTPELFFKLAKRNKVAIDYKSETELEEKYNSLSNLEEFLKLYYEGTKVLQRKQDFFELTWNYVERAFKVDTVTHFEIFFDPQAHINRGVEPKAMMMGMVDAMELARKKFDIKYKLNMNFLRDVSLGNALKVFGLMLPFKKFIHGMGIDSNEIGYPPSLFYKLYNRARQEGFALLGHGGHDGPAVPYVSELLEIDGLNRIDHGIFSAQNPLVLNTILRRRIHLSLCPLSNIKIGPIKSMKEHPIVELLKKGVQLSINSDDPAYLGSYISENYFEVARALELKLEQVKAIAQMGFTEFERDQ